MKENMKEIVLVIILFLIIGSTSLIYAFPMKKESNEKDKGNIDSLDLLIYKIVDNYSLTNRMLTQKQYEVCPPLRPDRFRRRVKMILGVDINDYPKDAVIYIGGYAPYVLTLSKNTQTLDSFTDEGSDPPFTVANHSKNILPYVWEYIFINDALAEKKIKEYTVEIQNKYFDGHQRLRSIDYKNSEEAYDYEGVESCNFLVMLYHNLLFNNNVDLLKYNIDFGASLGLISSSMSAYCPANKDMYRRISDLRLDLLSIYTKKEIDKGKKYASDCFNAKSDEICLGFDPTEENSIPPLIHNSYNYGAFDHFYKPWRNHSAAKGISSSLNYLLQFQEKQLNKVIIKYLSGQIDKELHGIIGQQEKVREDIRSNNYYGYTVLREFCENPMREMPTLEKIGTNFESVVKEKDVLLYLEPFAESYDIDTIQPTESFKAYEMGHDDYYFVEIEKPVESPIADSNGYAKILDRTEIVHGYVLKSVVKQLGENDILGLALYTDLSKSKNGVINDPDGYTNIRSEQNTKSTLVGKIIKGEVFNYWQTNSDWWIVQTKIGERGYVYKSRIKEKSGIGGWVLD